MCPQDNDRFECILEPFDTWMIWDRLTREPAIVSDELMMSLDYEEAQTICLTLNRDTYPRKAPPAIRSGASPSKQARTI